MTSKQQTWIGHLWELIPKTEISMADFMANEKYFNNLEHSYFSQGLTPGEAAIKVQEQFKKK